MRLSRYFAMVIMLSAVLMLLGLPRISAAAAVDELLTAVNSNDIDKVKGLINARVDVSGEDGKGNRPLFRAALQGNPQIVKLLLDAGADPNLTNKLGWSPLFIALAKMKPETRHGEVIDLLLARGANPKLKDKAGLTLLMVAVRYNHPGMVQRLLKLGLSARDATEAGETVLHMLGRNANMLRQQLIEAGADVNVRDKEGGTPLMVAIINNDYDGVKLLLDKGAALEQPTVSGMSPLTAACAFQVLSNDVFPEKEKNAAREETVKAAEQIVRLLLERGANVNALSEKEGFGPLHGAVITGTPQVVALLLEKGAKIEQPVKIAKDDPSREMDGATPLLLAAGFGRIEVVELLLARGADSKARTSNGYNAAMFAVVAEKPEMQEFLRKKGLSMTAAEQQRVRYDMAVDAQKELGDMLKVIHEALCRTLEKEPSLAGAPQNVLMEKAGYKAPFEKFRLELANCDKEGCQVVLRHSKLQPEQCRPEQGVAPCTGRISGARNKAELSLPGLVKP